MNLPMPGTMLLLGLALLALSGCERGADSDGARSAESASAAAPPTLPDALFVDTPPADARPVGELFTDAEAEGNVVITGRIGGRLEPFVDTAAVFVIADAQLKSCDQRHNDGCPTPWDYCCEPRENLLSNLATVQIVDERGRPLPIGLLNQKGLKPLATVTIEGEMLPRATPEEPPVINARRIHVAPEA